MKLPMIMEHPASFMMHNAGVNRENADMRVRKGIAMFLMANVSTLRQRLKINCMSTTNFMIFNIAESLIKYYAKMCSGLWVAHICTLN